MRFAPRRPRRPSENVVPLINVVFLLLVFFMLTGSLRPPSALELELPRERSDAPAGAPRPDALTLALSRSGDMALAGARIAPDALATELRARGARTLLLRADARTPAAILLPVLETLESLGVAQVDLVTDLAR